MSLRPQGEVADPDAVRLVDLLGLPVFGPSGQRLGSVNDVRLAPTATVRGASAEYVIDGFIVSDKHAGSFLGYDRRREQGPLLLRWIVRRLHRNAGYAPWSVITDVDWEREQVLLTTDDLQPLDTA